MLEVDNLSVRFRGDRGWLPAVAEVSFGLGARESLGIVGESGSGKSVTALAILRLHARSTTAVSGAIRYAGQDVLTLPEREMRRLRGGDIAMVFQDPMSSLNPVLTIEEQIGETLRLHQGLRGAAARRRTIELLDLVRIPDAARRIGEYPHRLSGGMRQRVMIAIAIACQPKLLIADEPTTALDVTIQAQILDLLRRLQQELGMALILITHDLGIVAEFTSRIVVMYAGRVVEQASAPALFATPLHPYTAGLLGSIPPLDRDVHRLAAIPGTIPDPGLRIDGCRFHPRCTESVATCATEAPALITDATGHASRCPVRMQGA